MNSIINSLFSGSLVAIPGLLIAAYFYSKVTGKSAPYRADISAHRSIGISRGFWYQLWILFITPLMFLYNVVVDTVWFLTEIFHFTVFLFSIVFGWMKWIWLELLWPGINFVWQNFVYYFWDWPWQQIQLVFSNIIPVASSTYLLAGMLGTSAALILIHIGRWLDYLLNNSVPVVMMTSCALATSMLAFGSGIISSMLRTNSKKGGWATVKANVPNGKKSAIFLLTYAVFSIILVVIEWGIWRSGWIHQWGNITGGVLSGPALLMSIVSVLNLIILVFATSLGSHFMLDNTSSVKDNSIAFIMLSLRNIGSLIFTAPFTLLNGLILSFVPVILFVGSLKLTQQITSYVRTDQEKTHKEYLDVRNWTDTLNWENCSDSIFNVYLSTVQEIDAKSKDFARQINWGNQVWKMTGVKNTYLDFTPVQNAWKYDSITSQMKRTLSKIQKDSSAIASAMKKDTDSLNALKASTEIELQDVQAMYDRFKAQQSDSLLAVQWMADSTIEYQFKYATATEFDEMLNDLNERLGRFSAGPEMQKRQIKIMHNQIESTKREISENGKAKWMDTIAYLFMGIFYSLLWAFLISMAWVAFVAVWYAIYMKDRSENSEPFKVIQIWNDIKSKNNRQPLRSIITLILVVSLAFSPVALSSKIMSFVSGTEMNSNPENHDNMKKEDSVQNNPNTDIDQQSMDGGTIDYYMENEYPADTLNFEYQQNTEELGD